MNKINYIDLLNKNDSFTTQDFVNEFKKGYPQLSEAYAKKILYKYISNKAVARIGRNKYILLEKKSLKVYPYELSKYANKIIEEIKQYYPNLKFKVFELLGLNEFLNHQIAHNLIFIFVESSLGDFVFDLLKKEYLGSVLLNPSIDDIEKYYIDNLIIIEPLVTEVPNNKNHKYNVCLEQLVVDLLCNDSIQSLINENEIPHIINLIIKKYVIDSSKMFRYARRRSIEDKLKKIINKGE